MHYNYLWPTDDRKRTVSIESKKRKTSDTLCLGLILVTEVDSHGGLIFQQVHLLEQLSKWKTDAGEC